MQGTYGLLDAFGQLHRPARQVLFTEVFHNGLDVAIAPNADLVHCPRTAHRLTFHDVVRLTPLVDGAQNEVRALGERRRRSLGCSGPNQEPTSGFLAAICQQKLCGCGFVNEAVVVGRRRHIDASSAS